jgi:hypothetical protein
MAKIIPKITPYGSIWEKSEQAIQTDSDIEPTMPYGPGEYIKSGEAAKEWTGPTPWRKYRNRSTGGSPPFSDAELKQGYRKVK